MKIKKLFALIGLVPFIVSCGNSSIAGTYGFQMGKDNGTHIGFFVDLTDNLYEENNEYKDLLVRLSLSLPSGETVSDDLVNEYGSILDYFKSENGDEINIPGYYKLTDEVDGQGNNLIKVGISFKYLSSQIKTIFKDQIGEDLSDEYIEALNVLNDTALIQSLLYATYKNNTVYVSVPVGYEDVYYQLYWYGYDVQINLSSISNIIAGGDTVDDSSDEQSSEESGEFIKIVETTKHDKGTHPTKDEVAEINKNFAEEHEGMFFTSYRDYNVLQMGLAKR